MDGSGQSSRPLLTPVWRGELFLLWKSQSFGWYCRRPNVPLMCSMLVECSAHALAYYRYMIYSTQYPRLRAHIHTQYTRALSYAHTQYTRALSYTHTHTCTHTRTHIIHSCALIHTHAHTHKALVCSHTHTRFRHRR